MLKIQELEYAYKNGPSIVFPSMECKAGEHWLILGQSGCGKTTLLHLLGGLLKPAKGKINVGETNIAQLPPSKLDQFRGKNIGIVFQKPHFVKALTVEENLMLAPFLAGLHSEPQKARSLLEKLNLAHKNDTLPENLSQGEQQRAAIARAMMNDPKIILADEPTSALDDDNCEEVIRLLIAQAEQNQATLLIVTHDQRLKDNFSNQILLEPLNVS